MEGSRIICILTLEFTAAQIKAINSFYDHFLEILNTYL